MFKVEGPFFEEIAKRKKQGKDAKICITARDAQTGVGKSSLAICLAKILDTSADGFNAEEKATLSVQEFLSMYDTLGKGSAMILDEAEQIDARRSMSNENVDASFRWQTRRVNEITAILTLPSIDMIDRRMERLQDYWIDVTARGSAIIYKKKIHPTKKSLYYKTLQQFQWPSFDWDEDYRTLARMKEDMISDKDSDDNWVRRGEVDEMLKKERKQVEKNTRDKYIRQLAQTGLKNTDIAPAFDLSPQRIGQIVRGEG